MNDEEFSGTIADPRARTARYEPMVRAYFDRVTDIYRQYWGDSFHFAIFRGEEALADAVAATERWIGERGDFRPGLAVLDIGCGVAGPAVHFAERFGVRITGVNLSERQVGVARERAAAHGVADRVRFVIADGMRLPLAERSFDRAYDFEAGCHMPDKAGFARECARVLRPGGVFLGLDWMRGEGLGPAELARYVEPICRFHSVPDLSTLAEFGACLEAAGFRVEELASAAAYGDILRNWELLDEKTIAAFRASPPDEMDPTLRFVTEGGVALAEGARARAFVLGHWRAVRR
jgi:SAM-dependent methyltransferase